MLLSLMIFVPLLGMIVVLLLPRESEELIKRVTLLFYTNSACTCSMFYSYRTIDQLLEHSTLLAFLGLRHSTSIIMSALTV